jgi:CBS domain containing-hemolysin-like protein
MAVMPYLSVFGLLIFAGISFFFALAESALFSLGKWQVQKLTEASAKGGEKVASLLSNPQHLLATIVLGNTVANACILAIAIWDSPPGRLSHLLLIGVLFIVILFICEVIPKTLAVRAPEKWALRVAGPMYFLQKFTGLFQSVAQGLDAAVLQMLLPKSAKPQTVMSDEEYQELIELAYQQGTLKGMEKEIILQIIALDRQTVKEVMRPRSQMAAIPDDLSIEEMIEAARKYKHSRLPMYDESLDTIVGVLNTRLLLLDPNVDLVEAIEFPSFVPESMSLLQLLRSLQRQKRGIAIVLDEFGTTAGIVAIQDILEQVVGDIRGEGEAEGFVMDKLDKGKWRVNGTMRLDDFRREHPAIGEVDDVETLGGLIVHECEVVPVVGESIHFRGLKLTVVSADDRRVRELLVEKLK